MTDVIGDKRGGLARGEIRAPNIDMLDPGFLERVAPFEVRLPTRTLTLPILYKDVSAITGVFAVDEEAVRNVLPGALFPVRVTPRRGVLIVSCFDYKDTSIGPYYEVAIGLLAAPRRLPPLLGVLAERRLDDVAVHVRHLPVTTDVAMEAGRSLWGYPKFLADIRFTEDATSRTCELSEGGQSILRLTVQRQGRVADETRVYGTYSVCDGKLLHTSFLTQAKGLVGHRRRGARLVLGPHAIGYEVARWSPSNACLESRFVEHMQSILPPADWVSSNADKGRP